MAVWVARGSSGSLRVTGFSNRWSKVFSSKVNNPPCPLGKSPSRRIAGGSLPNAPHLFINEVGFLILPLWIFNGSNWGNSPFLRGSGGFLHVKTFRRREKTFAPSLLCVFARFIFSSREACLPEAFASLRLCAPYFFLFFPQRLPAAVWPTYPPRRTGR